MALVNYAKLILLALFIVLIVIAIVAPSRRTGEFTRICRSCGAAHERFARFCRRCGKRL